MSYRQYLQAAAFAGLAAMTLGCSDGTGPGGSGSASAVVHDNPSASGSMAPSGSAWSFEGAEATSGEFSGRMSADVQVQISADGSTWVDVGPPRSNASVTLQSDSETTVATNATVQSNTFSHVRVRMDNASATVNSGSEFDFGILEVDVNLAIGGDGSVVIEKQVQPFTVSAGSQTTVSVDLNSESWVTSDNVESRAVAESEIESATTVVVN